MINYVRLFTEVMPSSKAATWDRSPTASVWDTQALIITWCFILN